jgi:hypothetical protein
MSGSMDEALKAVEELEDADDEELYRQLGLRIKAMERDPSIAGQFAPPKSLVEPMGVSLGDVIGAGRQAFARLSKAGFGLLCSGGQGSRFDAFVATLGTSRMAVTAGLATLLVAQIGIAPAIAGVVAALAIGKAAPASVEAICAAWALKAGFPATTPDAPATTEPTTPSEPTPNPEPAPNPEPTPSPASTTSG